MAFTFERLIAVQYPLQRPFMCTVRRAKIIIGSITITTLTCHIYSLFTAGIIEAPTASGGNSSANGRAAVCDLLPNYYQAMRVVNLLDTVVTLFIPLVLILVMNSLIARNLIKFSRTFKSGANRHQSSPLLINASHPNNTANNIQVSKLYSLLLRYDIELSPTKSALSSQNHSGACTTC